MENIFPLIFVIIGIYPDVKMVFLSPNYHLIVDRQGTLDTITLEVETQRGVSPDDSAIAQQLAKKIKDMIGLTMVVDLKVTGALARSAGGNWGGFWIGRRGRNFLE